MLADPNGLGNPPREFEESLFDPNHWSVRAEIQTVGGGRGAAWFIGPRSAPWVLRHYRRGGLVAHVSADRYLWLGEKHVRAFAEWRLLHHLRQRGLPVPKPVAAFYRRAGLTYRCDLITERIVHAEPLSAALASSELADSLWQSIGAAIATLHRQGVDHADLNAHNILIGARTGISVIDFDRGRLRLPGFWRSANLGRLHRSLQKISAHLPDGRFGPHEWNQLLVGYQAG
jgi:3-deoxy-D-manno-octulosonic acid kinase